MLSIGRGSKKMTLSRSFKMTPERKLSIMIVEIIFIYTRAALYWPLLVLCYAQYTLRKRFIWTGGENGTRGFPVQPIYCKPSTSSAPSAPSALVRASRKCNGMLVMRDERRPPSQKDQLHCPASLPRCSRRAGTVQLSDLWVSYTLKKVYGLGGARSR